MNRRNFIKSTTKAALATSLPIILPSGRLFAATGEQKVKHVVYCLFAGGIRNWESIDFKEGNLMPNILAGNEAINSTIKKDIDKLPKILDQPLQHSGTLFKNFRYKSTTTLHYNAHVAAISGKYANSVELMKPIKDPSIFEYFRKHHPNGESALNAWLVTDQLGPFPYLQYSQHSKYGFRYAANMIQPSTLFKYNFSDELSNENADRVIQLKEKIRQLNLSDKTFKNENISLNSEFEKSLLKKFINETYQSSFKNQIKLWDDISSNLVNDDLITIFTASRILSTFKPSLLVVNIQDSDIGHSNFTDYCNNINKADYALAKLWQTIQSDDALRDNTVLIAAPEFGRNQQPNTLIDSNGRYAVDHTGDELSQQMFCLIAGPKGIIKQNKVVNEAYGETIDILPTIAHLMGFYKDMPNYNLNGKILHEALV